MANVFFALEDVVEIRSCKSPDSQFAFYGS